MRKDDSYEGMTTKIIPLTRCVKITCDHCVSFLNIAHLYPKQRFHLTSRESGMIRATNSVAQMICTFPVSYFGGKGSKPKYLGLGVMSIGIG